MISGIYAIVNAFTGGCYIGSSKDCAKRMRQHAYDLRGGRHINPHLQNAWRRDGEESFRFEVLEVASEDLLLEREQLWLLVGTYNIAATAGRPPGLGRRYTDEEKARLSASRTGVPKPWLRGRTQSDEEKAKRSAANRGKKRTAEQRARIAAAVLGTGSAARSAALIGNTRGAVPCSDEKRAKLRGFKHTDESREKIAAAQKKRWAARKAAGLGRSN